MLAVLLIELGANHLYDPPGFREQQWTEENTCKVAKSTTEQNVGVG